MCIEIPKSRGFPTSGLTSINRCMIHNIISRKINGGLLQSFGDFCPSVLILPVFTGKGRLRESTHSTYILVNGSLERTPHKCTAVLSIIVMRVTHMPNMALWIMS